MAVSPVVIKGLVGLSAVSVTTIGIVCREQISDFFTSVDYQKLMADVGINADCKWQNASNSSECDLDEAKLKAIKFDGKIGDLTIEGHKSLKLKIKKVNDKNNFYKGLKFIFKNEKDTKIKAGNSDSNPIVLSALSNKEFKLKENKGSYSLESAWDISKLSNLIGLDCKTSGSDSTCTLRGKINVYKSNSEKITGATFTLNNNKKINFAKDSKGHNQGFKLTVSENIDLTGGTGSLNQLTKEKKSYEIGFKNEDWYLIEKDEQQIKEELVGVACTTSGTTTTCKPIKERTVSGLTGDNVVNLSLTRTNESDASKYPDGFKYTNSSDSKNYKINTSQDEYQFSEVTN